VLCLWFLGAADHQATRWNETALGKANLAQVGGTACTLTPLQTSSNAKGSLRQWLRSTAAHTNLRSVRPLLSSKSTERGRCAAGACVPSRVAVSNGAIQLAVSAVQCGWQRWRSWYGFGLGFQLV
jgi:hypothetical protein